MLIYYRVICTTLHTLHCYSTILYCWYKAIITICSHCSATYVLCIRLAEKLYLKASALLYWLLDFFWIKLCRLGYDSVRIYQILELLGDVQLEAMLTPFRSSSVRRLLIVRAATAILHHCSKPAVRCFQVLFPFRRHILCKALSVLPNILRFSLLLGLFSYD